MRHQRSLVSDAIHPDPALHSHARSNSEGVLRLYALYGGVAGPRDQIAMEDAVAFLESAKKVYSDVTLFLNKIQLDKWKRRNWKAGMEN